MRRALIHLIATMLIGALSPHAASADEDGPKRWRALGAWARGETFRTALSGRFATQAEAVASMRSACDDGQDRCALVATFNRGCRYVALGGRPTGPNVLAPVFLVGITGEEAQQKCLNLGLVCERQPRGGCID